jgi:hypothetical protein
MDKRSSHTVVSCEKLVQKEYKIKHGKIALQYIGNYEENMVLGAQLVYLIGACIPEQVIHY